MTGWGVCPTPSLFRGESVINTFTKFARWFVAALGIALLVFLLVNREYRESFISGSGMAQGALIAAIALGVILTYRGSGVVNFANGAIAMYIAYVYAVLRRDGDLF